MNWAFILGSPKIRTGLNQEIRGRKVGWTGDQTGLRVRCVVGSELETRPEPCGPSAAVSPGLHCLHTYPQQGLEFRAMGHLGPEATHPVLPRGSLGGLGCTLPAFPGHPGHLLRNRFWRAGLCRGVSSLAGGEGVGRAGREVQSAVLLSGKQLTTS